MSGNAIPKEAFANVNSKFNDAKARSTTYIMDIQAHISKQQDWFPEFNGYSFRGESQRLTDMLELENALRVIRDKFCRFDDTW